MSLIFININNNNTAKYGKQRLITMSIVHITKSKSQTKIEIQNATKIKLSRGKIKLVMNNFCNSDVDVYISNGINAPGTIQY